MSLSGPASRLNAPAAGGRRNGRRVPRPSDPDASTPAAVRVAHDAVPGRLRLRVPGLKRSPELAARVMREVHGWEGVRSASASATTGTVLLEFDPGQLPAAAIPGRVQGLLSDGAGAGRSGGALDRRNEAGELYRSNPAEDTGGVSRSSGKNGAAPRGYPARHSGNAPSPSVDRDDTRSRRVRADVIAGVAALAAGGFLIAVAAASEHELTVDRAPLELAAEIHSPAWTTFMRGVTRLADPEVVLPLTLAATAAGVGRQRPGELAWQMPVAVAGGSLLITTLKRLLRRARPAVFSHLTPVGSYSLPSGHAFLALCLYGLLASHAFRLLRARRPEDRLAPALLIAGAAGAVLLVGISRVYLGVHYPTDVLAGYLLAFAWLLFLAAVEQGLQRPAAIGG
jgi:undecaprenyl-diphosphatase